MPRSTHLRPVSAQSASDEREAGSDERLVALIRQGHESAFETLVSRYQARLLSFCWRILRSREDAEDALQDVLAAAFRAIIADERQIEVRPWLYRIAKNRCINELRRAKAAGIDSLDDYPAQNGCTVADKLTSQQLRDLVEDVQALPETQRTALLLREIDGFPYQRIATAMNTSVPAVKSLLVRARAGLRDHSTIRAAELFPTSMRATARRAQSGVQHPSSHERAVAAARIAA